MHKSEGLKTTGLKSDQIGSSIRWIWLALLVLVLDQLSKYMITGHMTLYQSIALMPYLNFTLVYNTGAAFSFLSDQSGWQRWFFSVISIAASIGISIWLYRLPRWDKWQAMALAFVLGGALGNGWDRLLLGYVVDFVDIYVNRWHWPAFNVADSAICIGVAMLLFINLRRS